MIACHSGHHNIKYKQIGDTAVLYNIDRFHSVFCSEYGVAFQFQLIDKDLNIYRFIINDKYCRICTCPVLQCFISGVLSVTLFQKHPSGFICVIKVWSRLNCHLCNCCVSGSWNCKPEYWTWSRFRRDVNFSAVQFHKFFCNGKSKAGSAVTPGIGWIDLFEIFEYIGKFLLRNSYACIGNCYFHFRFRDRGWNCNCSWICKFYRVTHYVVHYLLYSVFISISRGNLCIDIVQNFQRFITDHRD